MTSTGGACRPTWRRSTTNSSSAWSRRDPWRASIRNARSAVSPPALKRCRVVPDKRFRLAAHQFEGAVEKRVLPLQGVRIAGNDQIGAVGVQVEHRQRHLAAFADGSLAHEIIHRGDRRQRPRLLQPRQQMVAADIAPRRLQGRAVPDVGKARAAGLDKAEIPVGFPGRATRRHAAVGIDHRVKIVPAAALLRPPDNAGGIERFFALLEESLENFALAVAGQEFGAQGFGQGRLAAHELDAVVGAKASRRFDFMFVEAEHQVIPDDLGSAAEAIARRRQPQQVVAGKLEAPLDAVATVAGLAEAVDRRLDAVDAGIDQFVHQAVAEGQREIGVGIDRDIASYQFPDEIRQIPVEQRFAPVVEVHEKQRVAEFLQHCVEHLATEQAARAVGGAAVPHLAGIFQPGGAHRALQLAHRRRVEQQHERPRADLLDAQGALVIRQQEIVEGQSRLLVGTKRHQGAMAGGR